MNGWTPTAIIFLSTVVFGAGGVYWAVGSVSDRVEAVEQKKVIERPEFDAVVKGIEKGQATLEKGQDEIKEDMKNIERLIREGE